MATTAATMTEVTDGKSHGVAIGVAVTFPRSHSICSNARMPGCKEHKIHKVDKRNTYTYLKRTCWLFNIH